MMYRPKNVNNLTLKFTKTHVVKISQFIKVCGISATAHIMRYHMATRVNMEEYLLQCLPVVQLHVPEKI